MDLCPVDDHFSMNRWLPILAYEEDISILFCLEELISHKARNCEVSTKKSSILYFQISFDFVVEMLVLDFKTSYDASTLA
jgi:hypothetical protein